MKPLTFKLFTIFGLGKAINFSCIQSAILRPMEKQVSKMNISVLYVDDEQANLDAFLASFRRHFKIHLAIGGEKAKEILSKSEIHVIVTDQRMPNMLGTELLEFAVQNYPLQTRILLTAYSDLEALDVAINKGKICKYLKKPWNETELIECIREAYKVYQLRFEKEQIARELNETNEKLEALLKGKLGVM